jgi:hypothetical protein
MLLNNIDNPSNLNTGEKQPPEISSNVDVVDLDEQKPPEIASNETAEKTAPPVITSNEPLQETKPKVKPSKPIKENLIARKTITANLKGHEVAQIENIIKWRIAEGKTTSYDNFARQCIDFTINHGKILSGYLQNVPKDSIGLFALPETHDFKPFEDKGFFNN